MSDRYCAWIRIGGRIERSKLGPLLGEIQAAGVSLGWGEPPFEPTSVDALVDAKKDDILQLCDNQARNGEFPELEEVCRELELAYTRFCEAYCGYDAEIVDFRPGMKEPLIRTCSNEGSDIVLVDAATVKEALTSLEAGRTQEAIAKLRSLCPQISDLPPFEIV